MWNDTPQGMHIKLNINGTIILHKNGRLYSQCDEICDFCQYCEINIILLFLIPRGLYIDPFELQVS